MPEPVQLPRGLADKGEPSRISVYRDASGDACFAVARWDSADGKDTRPIVWDGKNFRSALPKEGRPLYNSDIIVANPDAPVLVVEGEKTAEEGVKYLPHGWQITTWAGGTGAVDKTDWSILADRRVVIWPDNDEPGRKAANAIREKLKRASVVTVSKNYPPQWDLADELPAMVTPSMVTANIMDALSMIEPEEEAHLPVDITGSEPGTVEEELAWRPLGFDDQYFYTMPASTRNVVRMTARDLASPTGCLRIVNDMDYWRELFPPKRGSSSEADWISACSSIMRACTNAGYYDPRRICGRGVWLDTKRVVVNLGNMLIVDGKPVNPVSFNSNNVYKTSEALFMDGFDPSQEATDAEGRMIVELCNLARWEREVFGDLLAGYIATAPVCGGLDWRTHVWVTGNSGSGKSTVINNVVSPCIGDLALYPLGETTEAGIRQAIGQDALPVIFDEMEGTDQSRSQRGDERRQAIIQLMRMASTDGRGRILKGGANHSGASFTMKSAFLVASIGVGLKEAPDLTRTMILSLKPLSPDASKEDKDAATEQFKAMNRLAARIPVDMPERLFARLTKMLPTIRANALTFREVIAERLGNRRLGDQIGTLLAGRCALTSKKLMTREECDEYLNRFNWDDVTAQSASEREDNTLLLHLRRCTVRMQDTFGRMQERLIGELILIAMREMEDENIKPDTANSVLMRHGLRVATHETMGVYLAKGSVSLDALFRTSRNPSDWWSVVSRYPGCIRAPRVIYFAGVGSKAIFIPKEAWVK